MMRRALTLLLFLCPAIFPDTLFARPKIQGWCGAGAPSISIPGTQGSGTQKVLQVYPSCTIRIYYPGTTTLIPSNNVYSTESGTVKGNPFTAALNSLWFAYIDEPDVDVNFSGGGIASPFTLGHYLATPFAIVSSFGAKCDGSTNDYAAFNTASTAMAAAGGGVLIIPSAKNCLISTNLTMSSAVDLLFEAGAKITTSATLTISGGVSGPLRKIFSYSGSGAVAFASTLNTRTLHPEWWGLGDGSTGDGVAVGRACTAMPTNTELVFPYGTYSLTTGRCTIINDYQTFRGQGIGGTVLQYASASDGVALFSTYGANVDGLTVQDLTIQNTTTGTLNINYGVAVRHYPAHLLRVSRVEFMDVPGNSPIQAADGLFSGDATLASAIVEDCWFHWPNVASVRDAINIGGMREIRISRNRIENFRVFAFEGGGAIYRLLIEGNTMVSTVGQRWLSNIAGEAVSITGNQFLGLGSTNGSNGINYSSEGTDVSRQLIIANNVIYNDGTNAAAFEFGSTPIPRVVITGNNIQASGFITNMPDSIADFEIGNNLYYDLRATSSASTMIRACCTPGPTITGRLNVHDNVFDSSTGDLRIVNPGTAVATGEAWQNLKSTRVTLSNNRIGDGLANANTGAFDGNARAGSAPSANAGLISSPSTIALLGALVTDGVLVTTDTATTSGVGITVHAHVTTSDLVTYWTDNRSGANFDGTGVVTRFWIIRK